MRCICAYCGILYDVKPPLENDDETHGICEECMPAVMKSIEEIITPGEALMAAAAST